MNNSKHKTSIHLLFFIIFFIGCLTSCIIAKKYAYPNSFVNNKTTNQNEILKRNDYVSQFLKIGKYIDQNIFEEELHNKYLINNFCNRMQFVEFLNNVFLMLLIASKVNRRRFLEESLFIHIFNLIDYIHSIDGKIGLNPQHSMLIVR